MSANNISRKLASFHHQWGSSCHGKQFIKAGRDEGSKLDLVWLPDAMWGTKGESRAYSVQGPCESASGLSLSKSVHIAISIPYNNDFQLKKDRCLSRVAAWLATIIPPVGVPSSTLVLLHKLISLLIRSIETSPEYPAHPQRFPCHRLAQCLMAESRHLDRLQAMHWPLFLHANSCLVECRDSSARLHVALLRYHQNLCTTFCSHNHRVVCHGRFCS